MGAILKKMAVFKMENAFCLDGFVRRRHVSVLNRSLVDFKQMNEAYDDDLHENGWFIKGKRVSWFYSTLCRTCNVLTCYRSTLRSKFYLHKDFCAAEIFPPFQILYPRSCTRSCTPDLIPRSCALFFCGVIYLLKIDHWSISNR